MMVTFVAQCEKKALKELETKTGRKEVSSSNYLPADGKKHLKKGKGKTR